jgi:hypothetical protein
MLATRWTARVEMGPGEASIGNDQHCKPDTEGRKGRRSCTVGNQAAVLTIVQLDKDLPADVGADSSMGHPNLLLPHRSEGHSGLP